MPLSDQDQTNLGLVALVVAVAQTLGEQDQSFSSRLDARIQRLYETMSDYPAPSTKALEMLRWAHELIRDSK